MNKSKKLSLLLVSFLCLGFILLLNSCAQMASPPGGKKDTLAPVLLQSNPTLKSKNFKGKKLDLTFNEYVDIKNVNQELLVTPGIGFYETKIYPKGLSIILDSALNDNTTYTFNFRNSISDISERNVAKNIKLVFSTGNIIDSLSIEGNVKNLFTNKKLENILVAVYPYSDTLKIDKQKPYYFTKTDTSGNYQLENLKAGKYYMAAFADVNNNLLLNANKEAHDFQKEAFIDLKEHLKSKDFILSNQNLDSLKIIKTTTTAKSVLYEFNRGIQEAKVEQKKSNAEKIVYQIEQNKQLRIFRGATNKNDTLFIKLNATDSLNRLKEFSVKIKYRELNKKEKLTRKPFNLSVYPKFGARFSPLDSIQLDFEKPVASWNIKKIYYKIDSLKRISIDEKNIKFNSYSNQLIISKKDLPKEKVNLIFEKDAFVSIEQDSTDYVEYPIEREELENFGLISGKINSTKKDQQYVVQLIKGQEQEIAYSQIVKENFTFNYIEPNIYTIRVIEDLNKDGKWTPGNFQSKKVAERMFFYPMPLKLKANFELTDLVIQGE